ncbi:MAG: glycoside hydrolase family 3 N-terminal domain-containing protein [Bacteroidota bacterium]|nr:glycoside hydrolase family 3 N-terminal domain-containing protein [Bacteroidota bacterium]
MRILLFLLSLPLLLSSQPTLQQKIAQMVMVGFTGTAIPDSIKVDIQQRSLGGIILFANNIAEPNQIRELASQLSVLSSSKLLLAVDQEGGKVARLGAANGYSSTPTAFHLGSHLNREDSTRVSAALMAGWLNQAGFNINFAPVADVNVNPLSPAIGKSERSYSANPDTVSQHISWFIDEFHKKKIITTLKHFPGHGSATADSHLGFTDVTNTWTAKELEPFRTTIKSGSTDVIMAGHLFNAKIDSQYPASLSYKTITELLRDSLHFDGVVISDELFMKAIAANFLFDDALELCVKSGTDILLFSKSVYNNQSLTAYVVDVITSKVQTGKIPLAMIDSAYGRIQRLKQRILTTTTIASSLEPNSPLLDQNYPNPFNPVTTIKFVLQYSNHTSLKIYDVLGREVATAVEGKLNSGIHSYQFSGVNLASGVYIYRIVSGNFAHTKKMVLQK